MLSLIDLLPNGGGDGTAFEFLTVENMRLFNESTPDVEGVHYFSWGAVYEPGLIDTWKCVRSFDVRPTGFPRLEMLVHADADGFAPSVMDGWPFAPSSTSYVKGMEQKKLFALEFRLKLLLAGMALSVLCIMIR